MNQANVTESYGPLLVTSNAKNLMRFGVDVSELQHRNGKLLKVVPVATWSTDMPETFVAKPNMTFVKIEPKIPLYRIVTVIVRRTIFLSTFYLLPIYCLLLFIWIIPVIINIIFWIEFRPLWPVQNNDITSFPCLKHSSKISNPKYPKRYFSPNFG